MCIGWSPTSARSSARCRKEQRAERNPGFTEIEPYAGPFPPSGTHDYEFTLYALRTDRLGVRPGATLQEFRRAAEQNSLATATLIGKFTKIS